jgi:hypothetical protein
MIGLGLLLLGLIMGGVGLWLLKQSGSGWRIGRVLSAAPQVSLEEAAAHARSAEPGYVRIHGRIDSDEEFPSEEDQPLVFRRRQQQRRAGSEWQTFDDQRLAVRFRLVERGQRIDIETEDLGDGLVVVPRLSIGVAGDLSEEAATAPLPVMARDTPVRLRIDQVSAIEHATATGVPREVDGVVTLGSGHGRPLILTTLDPDEAMRVLASDKRTSLLVASGLLVFAPIVAVLGIIVTVATR